MKKFYIMDLEGREKIIFASTVEEAIDAFIDYFLFEEGELPELPLFIDSPERSYIYHGSSLMEVEEVEIEDDFCFYDKYANSNLF